jgi:hypothetical protein
MENIWSSFCENLFFDLGIILNVLIKLLEKIRVSSQLTKNVRIITLALFLQKTTKQRILKNNDLKFCNQRLRAL